MTGKEKLVAMVGKEKADQYINMVKEMEANENQPQAEEKTVAADV